jgi:hypothetical protein
MTVNYLAIRLGEDRHGEAELADAGPDLIDGLVILARVTFVRLQPFDGPVFNAEPGERGCWIYQRLVSSIDGAAGHALARL